MVCKLDFKISGLYSDFTKGSDVSELFSLLHFNLDMRTYGIIRNIFF